MTKPSYTFSIVSGRGSGRAFKAELKALFDGHYGVWDNHASRPGEKIKFRLEDFDNLLENDYSHILVARDGGCLIGYAIGARVETAQGWISWVTQLVIHSEYQYQGIASRLLKSAWTFSSDFAWGLASANPYAIRALETATLRRCDPDVISRHLDDLGEGLPQIASYLDAAMDVSGDHAKIDTRFYVSHANIPSAIANLGEEVPWKLGQLRRGEEWLAVVFQDQTQRDLVAADVDELCDAGGSVVAEAYDRMAKGAISEPHPWMKHTASEVDAVVKLLQLPHGATILDIGCGNGRHAIELAKRGYRVTAVDRSHEWLGQALASAREAGQEVAFLEGDARALDLGAKFDAVISLYDVLGSFRTDEENQTILNSIRRHLDTGRRFALSVMNRIVAEKIATMTASIRQTPNAIHSIPPSTTMQDNGDVWNPAYFLADPSSGLVYRRERFGKAGMLPIELLICDRRYKSAELKEMCVAAGLRSDVTRPVKLGAWDTTLPEDSLPAKEILCAGEAE